MSSDKDSKIALFNKKIEAKIAELEAKRNELIENSNPYATELHNERIKAVEEEIEDFKKIKCDPTKIKAKIAELEANKKELGFKRHGIQYTLINNLIKIIKKKIEELNEFNKLVE